MLKEFFHPIITKNNYQPFQIGDKIIRNQSEFPDLDDVKMAIFGIGDGSLSPKNLACGLGIHDIRESFYELVAHREVQNQIIDLGDLILGKTAAETLEKVEKVIHFLQEKKIFSLIIGGSIDLGFGVFKGFSTHKNVDLSFVSAKIPILEGELLHNICIHEPSNLFNINVLAHQGHLVPEACIETLAKMNFEQCRLGQLKSKPEQIEPLLRNSDFVLFDINALKHSDAPGKYFSYPSGLDAELACKIAWYAGISDQTKSFGIFEVNPELDQRNQTSIVAAEILWYLMDGFFGRKNDHPNLHNDFLKYRCYFENKMPDVVFYKSKITNRWWMEVNVENRKAKQVISKLIPCSYDEYVETSKGNFPDLYLKAMQKWG